MWHFPGIRVILLCLQCTIYVHGQSVMSLRAFCSNPNTISVIGGVHTRLVNEGGRIALTCCMPGASNGHDHEQLVWVGPSGDELSNHFSAPHTRAEHMAYSVPDFRSTNHLVTMLVIQNFRMEDAGQYTCKKANPRQNIESVRVTIIPRPRLLADYTPLTLTNPEDSGSAVVAGRPVFVVLEEGRSGQLTCRRNPQFRPDQVQITWYFQGRQLIAPAMAIPKPKQLKPISEEYGFNQFNPSNENSLNQFEYDLAQVEKEKHMLEANRRIGVVGDRPVSLDPAELGINLLDDSQVLSIHKADSRHSGIYLCKAEALNPAWTPERSQFDPPPYESGAIEAPMLVQLQAIRSIVFSPPRMLPGSPSEVHFAKQHESGYRERRLVKPNLWSNDPIRPGDRFYMEPFHEASHVQPIKQVRPQFEHIKPVAQEGGQLILECQARGKPTPQLIWYRGGMGTSTLIDSKAVTFDQRVKEALHRLPLVDVQRQLGMLIADNNRLYPSITNSDKSNGQRISNAHNNDQTPLGATFGEMKSFKLGRFELSVGSRKDDMGDPVITVSRLTINHLQPSDATRYTCLALLDLGQYGGSGNYTDVGSVLPDVVMRPRIIKYGTHLHANGYPGDNATLTCEAYGGLDNPQGLRIRFLRGQNVPQLIKALGSVRDDSTKTGPIDISDDMGLRTTAPYDLMFKSGPSLKEVSSVAQSEEAYDEPTPLSNLIKNGVEVVRGNSDSRHKLTKIVDPHNPYASILQLNITDLKPEDNAYYACEALSGPNWRVIAPTAHEGAGRLTVWFPPKDVIPRTITHTISDLDLSTDVEVLNRSIVYGLTHLPSKLACQAKGQPFPTWVWHGPQTGPDIPLGDTSGPEGYTKVDYLDGEWSVSELKIPASYRNVGVFGTYSCMASNRLGSATALIRLKMATHPDKPSLRACKVEAQVIELCVDPPKDTGGLPLTHYELLIQTHPQGGFYGPFAYLPGRRLVRLPHLIPGYYYRFALSAVSEAGRGPNAYLEVTTNKLSTPAIKMLTAQEYIEPTAYNVHWKTSGATGPDIEQYKISVRPVEVDYSMGEISGRPIGGWTEYAVVNPDCTQIDTDSDNYPVCQFRVDKLEPDKAYELELSAQNSVGFSQAQRIIFRTSTAKGESGRLLNMPSYLRQTAGNVATHVSANIFSLLFAWQTLSFMWLMGLS